MNNSKVVLSRDTARKVQDLLLVPCISYDIQQVAQFKRQICSTLAPLPQLKHGFPIEPRYISRSSVIKNFLGRYLLAPPWLEDGTIRDHRAVVNLTKTFNQVIDIKKLVPHRQRENMKDNPSYRMLRSIIDTGTGTCTFKAEKYDFSFFSSSYICKSILPGHRALRASDLMLAKPYSEAPYLSRLSPYGMTALQLIIDN